MAKQIKKVIDERTAKLKALGYELVPESKGAYQTIREVDRLTIERKDIEYLTEQEWSVVMEKVEADHTKHMKAVEGEHIPQPEHTANGASEGIGTTMVVTMDINKDVAALIVDTNKLAIAEMKKAYAGLEFKDLKDEANNNLIKTGHDKARKLRIAVEKRETFLKAPYIAGSKKIGEVAKEYYFLLGEIENPLKEQVNLMKAAEAAEETRKLEELEKEGTRRVEVLKEAGMRFDGQFYCIAERSMDYASIKAMTLEF